MCIDPMDTNNESILELAANNDVTGFKKRVDFDPWASDEPGLWHCRKKGSNLMTFDLRTPLMVAAIYGSLDVIKLIVALPNPDINRCCGEDRSTALHCAASGGSVNAVEVVTLLLAAGADVGILDASGARPSDVISVSPKLCGVKFLLEGLLGKKSGSWRVSTSPSSLSSPPLSSSPDMDGDSLSPSSNSTSSPMARKDGTEKKGYPVDPSLPDIKNGIYSTDDFRMFSFKVRPCSRAYSHDWTECPFVHPGENARRRDPRKYHYSCVPCPEFRKGTCQRGDLCEYAHGVFECWLHPAQYRTRLCKDGTTCARRVCFFAHKPEELRPLYVSTGSGVPSPRTTPSAMEMAAAMSQNIFMPPMSPSSTNVMGRQQPSVPTLHLPGSNNLQSSRLRSSLSARDMPVEPDLLMLSEFDMQHLNGVGFLSNQARFVCQSKSLNSSNLEELFSAEISSSPRYNSDQGAIFSPKSAILNQFQQQQQQILMSPIRTNSVLSPTRSIDAHSPLSNHRLSQLSQQEKFQQLRSLSSRDLGSVPATVGSPVSSTWSKWGSPSGKVDWGVNGEELGRFRQPANIELDSGVVEPDVSWVQSLVNPPEAEEKSGGDGSNEHAVIGAWLEQMQLDHQMVAN